MDNCKKNNSPSFIFFLFDAIRGINITPQKLMHDNAMENPMEKPMTMYLNMKKLYDLCVGG